MKTQGHIITDEQFEEYETLKRLSGQDIVYVQLFEFEKEINRWGTTFPLELRVFGAEKEIKANLKKLLDGEAGKIQHLIDEQNRTIEHNELMLNHRIKSLYAKIDELISKRDELLKSPTIWEFIKNRKQLSK
jgi:hypothetical protein